MRRTLRLLIVLAVLVAAAATLGYRIQSFFGPLLTETVEGSSDPAADHRDKDIREFPQYSAPPIENFAGILERPLFAQSRRAAAVEAPAPILPPEPARLEATLHGVLFSAAGKVALISVRDSPEVVRVAENQLFLGWRLEQIEPDSATFTRGDIKIVLRLKYRPGD